MGDILIVEGFSIGGPILYYFIKGQRETRIIFKNICVYLSTNEYLHVMMKAYSK